jgi:hypothetical protein
MNEKQLHKRGRPKQKNRVIIPSLDKNIQQGKVRPT